MTEVLCALFVVIGFGVGVTVGAKSAVRRVRSVTAEIFPASPLSSGGSLPAALGGLEAASAVARDEAEASRESLGLIRRAMDSLPFGVVVIEQGTAVDWRNTVARNLLRQTRVGMVVSAAVRRQRTAALDGLSTTETISVQGPPERVLVVSGFPIPRDGEGSSGAVIIEDITARAHLEAVRKDFVANISHELRTPVGALALLAETLEDETSPEVISRLSGKLVDESHRVSRIIDDLLELSVLESGPVNQLTSEPVQALVKDARERVRALCAARSITVNTVGVAALDVPCDRRQLVSALSHLIENAVKYSEVGGSVSVRAQQVEMDIEFSVSDTGVGIPAKETRRIFERFYRVDPARSRNTGGTGLGLAIVRHVASNHHGDVSVDSTEGVGSTFFLRVPSVGPPDLGRKART